MAALIGSRASKLRATVACVGASLALVAACAAPVGDDGSGANANVGDASTHDAVVLGNPTQGDDGTAPGDDDAATGDDVSTAGDDGATGGKSCATLPDGALCGPSPDACHDAPVCAGGVCGAPANKTDGTVCDPAPDACHTDGTCAAGVCGAIGKRADGFEWTAGDATARCCGGSPIHTTSDTNCGACGITCNAGNGESCQDDNGIYFCRGCVASAACWSGCCSTSFTPYTCAASDCAGSCKDSVCPPGAHCVVGSGTSDYCAY
jgi:hypothetical protein